MKRILFIIVGVIACLGAVGQNVVGEWEGKLNIAPNVSLHLVLGIKEKGGVYSSKLISIDQGNAVIDGVNTTINNGCFTTTFSMIGAQYRATINEDELNGIFTQSGQQFPLIMTRSKSGEVIKRNRPQTPKAPYPYSVEEVAFTNRVEGNTLSGTLTIPKANGKTPAVVLVSGSGSQNRDSELFGHKPFWVIADYLSRHGVAVLRFDDRGVGKSSKGKDGSITIDIVYDAEAGVEYLCTKGEFSQVGVIGHSEGGIIAFLLAGDNSYKAPDFIVSMAGCGVEGAEVLAYQNGYALSQMKLSQVEREAAMATNRAIYEAVLNSKGLNEEVVEEVREVVEASIPANAEPNAAKEQVARVVREVISPWLYNFIKFNPVPTIEQIKCPVLALNGSLDRQVEAKVNLKSIESALKRGGNKQYEIVEYDGLNHLFQKAESGAVEEYGQIEETINMEVLKRLSSWINNL